MYRRWMRIMHTEYFSKIWQMDQMNGDGEYVTQ